MVIVIMGDWDSVPESVGVAIAESLGWDFLDIKKQFASCEGVPRIGNGEALCVELLSTVLDFSIYQWRDVVVSSPILTERDQKHLRDNRLLVKFVHLKASDDTKLRMNLHAEATTSGCTRTVVPTSNNNEATLTLTSSMEMTQIVDAVLTALVLRRRRTDFDAA